MEPRLSRIARYAARGRASLRRLEGAGEDQSTEARSSRVDDPAWEHRDVSGILWPRHSLLAGRTLVPKANQASAYVWRLPKTSTDKFASAVVELDPASPGAQAETRTGCLVIVQRAATEQTPGPGLHHTVDEPIGYHAAAVRRFGTDTDEVHENGRRFAVKRAKAYVDEPHVLLAVDACEDLPPTQDRAPLRLEPPRVYLHQLTICA